MASISSLGAGSGLFTNDLVNQLVSAERAPAELRLNQRQAEAEAEISAYGKISSALEALKEPLDALSDIDSMRAFVGSSSNESVATASVDVSSASRGSYSLDVQQLAQAQSLASASFADRDTTAVGTGTLSLNVGGTVTDITVDGSNNTLDGLAAAINDSNAGVSASVIDTGSGFKLVLSADESGTANAVQVSVTDSDGDNTNASGLSQFAFDGVTSNMQETVVAKDAIFNINGIEVTQPGNTIEGVIDGVTFNLLSVGTSVVKVDQDPDAVTERVQAFIDKFNELQDVVSSVAGFDSGSGVGGVLSGDSAVRSIQNTLRGMLTSIPAGLENSPIRTLGDIGITTDPSTGKLEFDESLFKDQLQGYPDSLTTLFAETDSGDGIAAKMAVSLDGFLKSDGLLDNRTDGLNKTLENISDQRIRLDDRIASYEERLIRQFSAADSLIAQIQSTGNYVSQQLAAIAPQSSSE
ncbi:flagellar filament capping protein FliD [Marinobacter salinexigens]|uniref:Flagellar hook-associated protein 2 n=2 Tax=Marinobacter salinexigens TaxID=2919747 RepID=A0A5B0VKK3_9GAMM|nr:flagellar filament capping protein FliD [Marinobacter salinexigens]